MLLRNGELFRLQLCLSAEAIERQREREREMFGLEQDSEIEGGKRDG